MGRSTAPVGGEIYTQVPSISLRIIIQKILGFVILAALGAAVMAILKKRST